MKTGIRTVKDLMVYRKAHEFAMKIYEASKKFPREELYSLTDQVRRSSRSVAINIREGYAKRKYEQVFIRHLNDALGSCDETRGWLEFAKDCQHLTMEVYESLDKGYDEIGAMLYSLMDRWETFSDI